MGNHSQWQCAMARIQKELLTKLKIQEQILTRKCISKDLENPNILHAEQGINLFVRDLKDILGNVKHSLLVHLASESQVLHHTLAGLQNLGQKC